MSWISGDHRKIIFLGTEAAGQDPQIFSLQPLLTRPPMPASSPAAVSARSSKELWDPRVGPCGLCPGSKVLSFQENRQCKAGNKGSRNHSATGLYPVGTPGGEWGERSQRQQSCSSQKRNAEPGLVAHAAGNCNVAQRRS